MPSLTLSSVWMVTPGFGRCMLAQQYRAARLVRSRGSVRFVEWARHLVSIPRSGNDLVVWGVLTIQAISGLLSKFVPSSTKFYLVENLMGFQLNTKPCPEIPLISTMSKNPQILESTWNKVFFIFHLFHERYALPSLRVWTSPPGWWTPLPWSIRQA